ncbi:Tetratricopeptide-like helical [Artemisia annua]|uniref:Tetratricopeptide-like helical n=1 Tax=Artemisia annua TaxID=35608 RepID=A0A2U1QAQ5_ARTAN|nr:Tetratricopeptide-like helical [Artemisia annua]
MNEAKVEGNKLFGEGLYDEALLKYDHAIQLAPEMSASAEIRAICHNNRATCFFKLEKYEDSVKECTKALELNPTYMKPLLRKAEAHEKLENYDDAITGKYCDYHSFLYRSVVAVSYSTSCEST